MLCRKLDTENWKLLSFLFQRAEQGVIVFARELGDFGDLRLGDLECVNARDTYVLVMYLKHDADRIGFGVMKGIHQHVDDKLHRREVVVVQQHLVERRLLQLLLLFGQYIGALL